MATTRSTESARQQLGELLEQAGHPLDLLGRPGYRDLIPAHVNIGIECLLDHVQEFIPGAKQADH
jgi:hypothetical protein